MQIGGFGLLIAFYSLRPVLSPSSVLPSDLHDMNGAKLWITNTGMKIKAVKVQCVTNKVIFEDKYTLALNRFVLVNEYAARDVGNGESFTADCNFAWSLWTKPTEGFFLFGNGVPGAQKLAIPFLFEDGLPVLRPDSPVTAVMQPYLSGYTNSQITAVDGSFVISHRWPLWFREERTIHMEARRTSDGLEWRVAPYSEPIIADVSNPEGFTVTEGSNTKSWEVTVNRVSRP